MQERNGSLAFLTGGGRGVGQGIARAPGQRGGRPALADPDGAALSRSGAELSEVTQVETVRSDVRDRAVVATAADAVESTSGPVALLFHNADPAPHAPVREWNDEKWDVAESVDSMA